MVIQSHCVPHRMTTAPPAARVFGRSLFPLTEKNDLFGKKS
jgi:hypothetical protein